MEIKNIKKEIFENYKMKCNEYKIPINRMILNYLEEEPLEDTQLSFIFRGNKDVHFNNRIKNDDLDIIILILMPFVENLIHIDLSYNWINGKIMENFSKFISKCVNLESLNLQFNDIEIEGGLYLFPNLIKMKNDKKCALKYLNLEGCRIGTEGIMGCDPDDKILNNLESYIEQFLKNNKVIEEINLSHNDIDEEGIIDIFSSLNQNINFCNLQILSLDSPLLNCKTDVIAFHLGRTLLHNNQLTKLSLRKFNLDDESIKIIFEQLHNNTCLRVFDLGANKFTFKGVKQICKYLKYDHCSLESLIMNNNRVCSVGAKLMSEALKVNKTLIHLDMTTNDIEDDGLDSICNSLVDNDTLVSLKLFWNHFEEKSIKNFHNLLNNPNPKRQSDWFLDFNTYNLDGVIQICHNNNILPYDIFVSNKYYLEEI